jgi:hypothetical protein
VLLPPRSAKWHPARDGGFCQTEVQAVGNGGERAIMAFHQARRFFFFRGVERDGSNFLVAGDAVDACRNIAPLRAGDRCRRE